MAAEPDSLLGASHSLRTFAIRSPQSPPPFTFQPPFSLLVEQTFYYRRRFTGFTARRSRNYANEGLGRQ